MDDENEYYEVLKSKNIFKFNCLRVFFALRKIDLYFFSKHFDTIIYIKILYILSLDYHNLKMIKNS